MKKLLIYILLLLAAPSLIASDMSKSPKRQMEVGGGVGVVSPLNGSDFISSMRPSIGLNFQTRLSPLFAAGLETMAGINTSTWESYFHCPTAIDHSYLGAYGSLDVLNLARPCPARFFTIALRAGLGWGHAYRAALPDRDYFMANAGMGFHFRISDRCSLSLTPSIFWELKGNSAAIFSLQAGVKYCFNSCDGTSSGYNQSQVDAINDEVNQLRQYSDVVREEAVDNHMNTVHDVFFHAGSAVISADQMPSVERIALQMNNNPTASVSIKGYASPEGNSSLNDSLSTQRAFAVRDVLISDFGISSSRISAQGCGVGRMFKESSWNRVSVCTIQLK